MAILRKNGWLVERAVAVRWLTWDGKWRTSSHDFFSSFDLIASKAGHPPHFIQVACHSKSAPSRKKAQVEKSAFAFDPAFTEVQVWLWHSPEKPGMRGSFEVRRRDDGYLHGKAHWVSTSHDRPDFPWSSQKSLTGDES